MIEISDAARRLLAPQPGEGTGAREVAERAVRICVRLAHHLSRILGDIGVLTLLRRSTVLAGARFPWLLPAAPATAVGPYLALQDVLAAQQPDVATAGSIEVLTTFVGLLKRLIGDGLVDRLLGEVWPTISAQAVKETPWPAES